MRWFTVTLLLVLQAAPSRPGTERWNGTWATAPAGVSGTPEQFSGVTLRLVVHTSVGGEQVRVTISNSFGAEPLVLGAVHVAGHDHDADIVAGTDRALTFGGRASFTVPPGAQALSDPVALHVARLSDLAVSVYLPAPTAETTTHVTALQTNYVSTPGDFTAGAPFAIARTITRWPFLTGVEIVAGPQAGAIVAFGDSITDGANSTAGTNHRWPDLLAARLQQRSDLRQLGVLDEGIIGNRILHPTETQFGNLFGPAGLARFDRDVLAQPGVRFLIVLLGINDIGHPGGSAPTSDEGRWVPAVHRTRARPRATRVRRDSAAVRGHDARRVFLAGEGDEAAGGEPVDPHERRFRRGDRLRRGGPGSGAPSPHAAGLRRRRPPASERRRHAGDGERDPPGAVCTLSERDGHGRAHRPSPPGAWRHASQRALRVYLISTAFHSGTLPKLR
jgi:hypothetical protein